jgi:Sec-independent protein translocase protein TatA
VRRAIVQTLRSFGWRQWLVVLLFAVVLGATALHATRAARRAIYWRQHQDEPISGWMTLGYVAHSYRVPPHVLYGALGLPPPRPGEPRDRRPLREIARDQGRTLDEIRPALQEAISRERAAQNARDPRGRHPDVQPRNDQPPDAPPRGDGGRP